MSLCFSHNTHANMTLLKGSEQQTIFTIGNSDIHFCSSLLLLSGHEATVFTWLSRLNVGVFVHNRKCSCH